MKMASIHKLECTILTKSHNLRKKKKSHVLSHMQNLDNNICIYVNKCISENNVT